MDALIHGKAEWNSLAINAWSEENNSFLEKFNRSVLKKITIPIQAMTESLSK